MGNRAGEKWLKEVVLVTHNVGKVIELGSATEDWKLVGLTDHKAPVSIENGIIFQFNTGIKTATAWSGKGLWPLVDDSGLEVDDLEETPGILTSDFGGWQKLLEALKGVPGGRRGAQFVCFLALHTQAWASHFQGICTGIIKQDGQSEGGFGCNPIFIPDGFRQTFAEIGKAQKSAISYRGKALAQLREWVKA